jgi:ABC-type phosphate transport system substrate-binding protein
MKRIVKKWSFIALVTFSSVASAQKSEENRPQEVFSIKGIKLADGLLKKWISEYTEIHPEVSFTVVDGNAQEYAIEVQPSLKNENEEVQTKSSIVPFGKYAILPIAGKDNVLLDGFRKKKLNEKRLKELFFERDLLSEDEPEQKKQFDLNVYSGINTYSVSHLFADHYGYEITRLKGKKIIGDDSYLNKAVQKDTAGVTVNSLSHIFNLESRQINEGIVLIPLDIKKEYAEILDEKNLDETILLLENKNIALIPVEELAFVLPDRVDPEVVEFLEWVLSEGQEYVHKYGFIQLDKKTLAQQQVHISGLKNRLLANR